MVFEDVTRHIAEVIANMGHYAAMLLCDSTAALTSTGPTLNQACFCFVSRVVKCAYLCLVV